MLTNDLPEQQTASGMTVLPIQSTAHLSLPYADDGVHAGFPAPAQSTMESAIDLNKDLIDNPESTFYARVEGDSMIGANIHEGDILIIDRSLTPTNGDIASASSTANLPSNTSRSTKILPFFARPIPTIRCFVSTTTMIFLFGAS